MDRLLKEQATEEMVKELIPASSAKQLENSMLAAEAAVHVKQLRE